jgi:hypothetical protein
MLTQLGAQQPVSASSSSPIVGDASRTARADACTISGSERTGTQKDEARKHYALARRGYCHTGNLEPYFDIVLHVDQHRLGYGWLGREWYLSIAANITVQRLESPAERRAPDMMSASATSGVLAVVHEPEVLETLGTPTCLDSRTGKAMFLFFTRGMLHLKAMHVRGRYLNMSP